MGDKGEKGYEILYWSEGWFDFNFPFRIVIEKIESILSKVFEGVKFDLPKYDDFEDFICFQCSINKYSVSGYFEQSLGYLSFNCDNIELLKLMQQHCNGVSFVHPGYGLEDG